ncbi:MAG TPA: ribosome maturation factor RimM [Gammaproteobacteria bacterium]|nr:ribosome maturation factor RimM [Gammaproteobacteria bacterium]
MNITLGKIVGVFGVRGWVKVFSETRPREQIFKYSPWTLEHNGSVVEINVLDGRVQGKGLVASLDGVTDCDAARGLIGAEISIPQQDMPAAGIDEYYWSQLTGLRVENIQGIDLGLVTGLFETGANDVMVVKSCKADREHLIPFTKFAVIDVDLDDEKIVVDWDPEF